jgi:hypothetical protein
MAQIFDEVSAWMRYREGLGTGELPGRLQVLPADHDDVADLIGGF